MSSGRLNAAWNTKAASYQLVLCHTSLCFAVFRILSVTHSLARAFSQSLTHAQHTTIAPRVFTLVLFIVLVFERGMQRISLVFGLTVQNII